MSQEKQIKLKNWSPVFLWIWIISLINTILWYSNSDYLLYFWLWITQILDSFWINKSIDIKNYFLIWSISISILFLVIDYFSRKWTKYLIEIWLILYWIDTLTFFLDYDIFFLISHIVILKIVYDSKNEYNN